MKRTKKEYEVKADLYCADNEFFPIQKIEATSDDVVFEQKDKNSKLRVELYKK